MRSRSRLTVFGHESVTGAWARDGVDKKSGEATKLCHRLRATKSFIKSSSKQ